MALIPGYTTREAVKRALDSGETARNNQRVDDAIRAASRAIEGMCRRRFYPELRTATFDYPTGQYAPSWRLWLEGNELISATSVVAGGVTILPADYFLARSDGRAEPPYSKIEINLGGSASFQSDTTPQQAISITGWFGYRDDQLAVTTLAEALDSSETGVDVASGAALGVGSLLVVDSERMIVTGRAMLDTTVNLGGNLAALTDAVGVSVASGAAFQVDETIAIDTERMLIVDIVGNTLVVERGYDGSVLAAHTAGADIYASRTLTVERGSVGSTAAAHNTSSTVSVWQPPADVADWCKAEALVSLVGESAAYATKPGTQGGSPAGGSIGDVRERGCRQYARRVRATAI